MGSSRTFEHLFGVRYETNGHYLGSLPDLIGHTGMQYHACTSFVSAQGEQVDFQELSKFTFLSNRACWPLEVIAILQTISRLLNCICRQLISGQMEENYQGNYKPHEIIAILCLFLISNFQKVRLHYIPQVGWSIGRSASPLIFSSDFLSLNLIHPICLIHPIHNHSTTKTRIAKDYLKGPASCK